MALTTKFSPAELEVSEVIKSRFGETKLFTTGETLPPLAWLLLRFRRDPARRVWVTAGLALTWGLDKALLILRDGGLRGVPLPWLLGTLGAALALRRTEY